MTRSDSPQTPAAMEAMESRILLDAADATVPYAAPAPYGDDNPALIVVDPNLETASAPAAAAVALNAQSGAQTTVQSDEALLGAATFSITSKNTFVDENGHAVTIVVKNAQVDVHTDETGHITLLEVLPASSKAAVNIKAPEGTTVDSIAIHGSVTSFTAPTVTLAGDLTATGGLKKLTLGDVQYALNGGAADTGLNEPAPGVAISLHTDPAIEVDPRWTLSASFGAVADCALDAADLPVKKLTAVIWNDGTIQAPRFGTIRVNALGADVVADEADAKGVSVTRLQAEIVDSVAVTAAGGIKMLKADTWTGGSLNAGWIGSLTLGHKNVDADFALPITLTGANAPASGKMLTNAKIYGALANTTWSIAGDVGNIVVIDDVDTWTLADFANCKKLTLAGAANVTVDGVGLIGKITADAWTGGAIAATTVNRLTIGGDILAAATDIDNTRTAQILGSMSGTWTGLTLRNLQVGGDLAGATVTLTSPTAVKEQTLGKLVVGGHIVDSLVRSAGHVGSITADGLYDSTILAGVAADYNVDANGDGILDLTSEAADFVAPAEGDWATIGKFTIASDKNADGAQISNSVVIAGNLGTVAVRNVDVDTTTPFGFAVGQTVRSVTWYDGNARQKWLTNSWPDDAGRFLIVAPGVNNGPWTVNDTAAGDEDTQITTGDVTANDVDYNGDALALTGFTQPSHGAVVNNADGTFTYRPDRNYNGFDSFTYTIEDGRGGSATGTVTLSVAAVNDAPTANDDTLATDEDSIAVIDVVANDLDVDGEPLTVVSVVQPDHASVIITGDGSLSYRTERNYNGTDTFTYTVEDAAGATATATVNVTVAAVNDEPVTGDDSAAGNEDTSITTGDVLANDSDVEGPLTLTGFTQPTHGAVVDNGDGTFTYTPEADFSGADSFTYTVQDIDGAEATATVALTVAPVNDAPVAAADSAGGRPNEALTLTGLLDNDADVDGDTLTITDIVQGAHGVAAINGNGTVTYTPEADFTGADSFTYTVSDGHGGTDTAVVDVTIAFSNDEPIVADEAYTTNRNEPFTTGNVLANDTDADGDALIIDTFTQPTHGTVVNNGDGTFTYTLDEYFVGDDSFTYTVSDGHGGADTGQVTITKPKITLDNLGAPDLNGVTLNGWTTYQIRCTADVGEDIFDVFGIDEVDGLHQVWGPTGMATTTADLWGLEEDWKDLDTYFMFTVAQQDLGFGISETNDGSNPTGGDFTDGGATAGLGTFEILVQSISPDAVDGLSYPFFQFVVPDNMATTVSGDAGQVGQPTIPYTFTVGDNANSAPLAGDDAFTAVHNAPYTTTNVLANDTDLNGDTIAITSYTQPEHGTVVKNDDGTFTYTLNDYFVGDDTFTYTVSDGLGGVDTGQVTITKPKITLDNLGSPDLNGEVLADWTTYRLRCTVPDGENLFDTFGIDEITGVHNVWGSMNIPTTNADLWGIVEDWQDLDTYLTFEYAQFDLGLGITETNDGSNPTGGDFTSGEVVGTAGIGSYETWGQAIKADTLTEQSYTFFQFVVPADQTVTVTGAAVQYDTTLPFSVTT